MTSSVSLQSDLLSKTCGNVKKFSHIRLIKEFSIKNWKKRTLDNFLCKLRTIDSIKCIVMIDFKICCLYVILVLPGSVETQVR